MERKGWLLEGGGACALDLSGSYPSVEEQPSGLGARNPELVIKP